MTQFELGIGGLKLSLALALLVFSYCFVLRKARLEAYRQDLFITRDDLWYAMLKLDCLDDPAHRRTRAAINAFIRLAPVTNLFLIFAIWLLYRKAWSEGTTTQMVRAVKNESARQAMREANLATGRVVLKHLVLGSFPGLLVGWPLYFAWTLIEGFAWLQAKTKIREIITACELKTAQFGLGAGDLRVKGVNSKDAVCMH